MRIQNPLKCKINNFIAQFKNKKNAPTSGYLFILQIIKLATIYQVKMHPSLSLSPLSPFLLSTAKSQCCLYPRCHWQQMQEGNQKKKKITNLRDLFPVALEKSGGDWWRCVGFSYPFFFKKKKLKKIIYVQPLVVGGGWLAKGGGWLLMMSTISS